MTGQVIEDPVLRQRYVFRRHIDADGAEVLEVEMWVDPGGGVTPHVHPSMEERFEVRAGRPEFLSGRRWQAAGPGEEVVVPAGTRHAFRNRGAEEAHFLATVRPPSTLQEFLEDVAALSHARLITSRGLPKGVRGLLAAAVLAHHYRDMAVLLTPPLIIQRILLDPLAPLGRRRGYQPGRFAETVTA